MCYFINVHVHFIAGVQCEWPNLLSLVHSSCFNVIFFASCEDLSSTLYAKKTGVKPVHFRLYNFNTEDHWIPLNFMNCYS